MSAREPGRLVDYSVYKASDSDEMARLLGDVFAQRDPPAVSFSATAVSFG